MFHCQNPVNRGFWVMTLLPSPETARVYHALCENGLFKEVSYLPARSLTAWQNSPFHLNLDITFDKA